MERFVIIVNGWKTLTIITKRSILDYAAALDLPLCTLPKLTHQYILLIKTKSQGKAELLLRGYLNEKSAGGLSGLLL